MNGSKKMFLNKYARVCIVAEISANHNHSFDRAVRLIKEAHVCGVDAVKFQVYTPETMTIDSNNECFMVDHPVWGGQSLFALYQKAYTPWEWLPKLKTIAEELGLLFFATAFDKTSVDFLETIDVVCHKIASFELVDIPLIAYMARKGKPMIISTGMASKEEISDAVTAARENGCSDLTLLKCVSDYPAQPSDMHVRSLQHMRDLFDCNVGISDHSLHPYVPLVAVSCGAVLVEKHFTLSRDDDTPDSFFSLMPVEMKKLVDDIRSVEEILGCGTFSDDRTISQNKKYRRSLFAVEPIAKGERFTESNVRSIRPGNGLLPKDLAHVLGAKAKVSISKGTPLSWDIVEKSER